MKPPPAPHPRIQVRKPSQAYVVPVGVAPVRENVKSFYHSGDLGDIIFSLPTVRALGGGDMIIGPCADRAPYHTRERMTPKRAGMVIPLLKIQPYISSARHSTIQPRVNHDLNQFRLTLESYKYTNPHYNLAFAHLRHFGLKEEECDVPWIKVDQRTPDLAHPVLVTRTLRYPGTLDWKRVVQHYGSNIGFIGLPEEHEEFCRLFGSVDHIPTANLLEVARLLSACEVFITNQNGCHAIAEGLKINVIQEFCPTCHVAMFDRENAFYELPKDLPCSGDGKSFHSVRKRFEINFRSPLDGFSGIGQSAGQFMIRLAKRGYGVRCCPTRDSELFGLPPQSVCRLKKPPHPYAINLIYETTGQLAQSIKHGDVGMTLWESDKWPQDDVEALNRCRLVLVTCKWNAETLKACGCTAPIKVVPLGIDPEIFYPGMPTDGYCTFGAAGRIAGAGGRKGVDVIISAFKEAFPFQKDVRLRIKVFSDCPVPEEKDSRIEIDRDYRTVQEMAEWHKENNAFISASRGEGFNLCLLEAMSCGAAPVACRYGGQAEFFDCNVGYEIPFHLEPATGSTTFEGHGNWAVPSAHHLLYIMRRIYFDQKEAALFGKKAAIRAAEFSWDHAVTCLERELASIT